MATESQQILKELKEIKEEIEFIKENMPDREMFLTVEERQLLEESYINEKNNELISGRDLRKKMKV
jgi:hypothetical protein